MFDPSTSSLLLLLSSPGFFYPQLGLIMPPFLEACLHALLYSLYQALSYSIHWGELSWKAQMWEHFLWFIPLGTLIVIWMGRIQLPSLSLPSVLPRLAGYQRLKQD